MRHTIALLGYTLIAVFVFLSLIDTSDYAFEKRLWEVKRKFNRVVREGENVSPQTFGQVISDYEKVIKSFSKSRQIPKVYLQIGRTYMVRKQWAEARKNL